jgi:hypothetical protein
LRNYFAIWNKIEKQGGLQIALGKYRATALPNPSCKLGCETQAIFVWRDRRRGDSEANRSYSDSRDGNHCQIIVTVLTLT